MTPTTNQPRAARRIDADVATNAEELAEKFANATMDGGIESIGILILRHDGGQMFHATGAAIAAMIRMMRGTDAQRSDARGGYE